MWRSDRRHRPETSAANSSSRFSRATEGCRARLSTALPWFCKGAVHSAPFRLACIRRLPRQTSIPIGSQEFRSAPSTVRSSRATHPETRLEKLRAFWEQVTTQLVFDPFGIADYWLRGDMGHVVLNRLRAGATMLEGAPGFFKPRVPPPYLAAPGTVEATSWYDTPPLRSTLE